MKTITVPGYEMGLPRPAQPGEMVALDLEIYKMTKLHRPTGIFACLSISMEMGGTYVMEDVNDVPKALERVKSGQWVFHNAMFDLRHLRRWAEVPQRPVWDTMLVDQDSWGGWYSQFSLDALVRRYLHCVMLKDTRKDFEGRESMTQEMRDYAAADAFYTRQVALAQREKLLTNEMMWYWEIDEPAMWSFLDMPGVRVDVDAWLQNVEHMQALANQHEEALGVNVYSSQQCHQLLLDEGADYLPRTDKGNPSVTKEVLEINLSWARERGRAQLVAVIETMMEARKYRHAVSNWGESWIEKHVEEDGKVYSDWGVSAAETGRTTSSDPNLQNIPKRDEELAVYRTFFVPSPGHRMLVADVSQQEPRFLAHLSGDENMLRIFKDGKDLHEQTMHDLHALGVDVDRRQAKDINLGTSYGMTPQGLADRTGITLNEAETFIRNYFTIRPQVRSWIDSTKIKARKFEFVRTVSGRPVWVNLHNQQWERNAVNGPIQGSAADQTKLAMAMIHSRCQSAGAPFSLVLEVHDEVVMDVPPGAMTETRQIVEDAFIEAAHKLAPGLPMEIGMKSGYNWGES